MVRKSSPQGRAGNITDASPTRRDEAMYRQARAIEIAPLLIERKNQPANPHLRAREERAELMKGKDTITPTTHQPLVAAKKLQLWRLANLSSERHP